MHRMIESYIQLRLDDPFVRVSKILNQINGSRWLNVKQMCVQKYLYMFIN